MNRRNPTAPPSSSNAPPLLQSRPDGTLYVVTGASRTGKTSWVVDRVRSTRRLLVWDSAGEFADLHRCERITDVRALAEAIKPGARARRLAFCVPVTAEHFGVFCRLAWVFICSHHPATVVVEELADVTSPNKAPTWWGELIRKGLRYGPDLYALTQRPAESDKTSIGNASVLHVHQCALEIDVAYMAKQLRVPFDQVDELVPLQWIERDRRTKQLSTGSLTRRGTRRARRASQYRELATRGK